MKTLLRIDSSIRTADSVSRAMADHFVTHWRQQHPTGRITTRDLQINPVPHLTQLTVQAFFGGGAEDDELALSDELIDEIMESDELLIACPMYNFQIPSSLKAYFDHVIRVNKTFQHSNGEYIGLIKNKKCIVLTTMGGKKEQVNAVGGFESYLRNILGFIGVTDTTIYCVDGTESPDYARIAMGSAKERITNLI